jgi:membrane dipeptidase
MLDNLLIFDAHCDTANVLFENQHGFREETPFHLDLAKALQGGVKAQVFAVWVDAAFAPHRAMKRALLLYQTFQEKVLAPGYGVKVTTVREMHSAIESEKLACWLFLEGGHIIENSIQILEFFRSIGFRGMTLTHAKNNDWADSSGDTPRWHGLNRLGRRIVAKMADLGMFIDVSHVSDETMQDVLETTSVPIMASHSNARALCDIPRNLPDSLIREIASRGGFIGVNFYPVFLSKSIYDEAASLLTQGEAELQAKLESCEDDPEAVSRISWEFYRAAAQATRPVSLTPVIDHIVHIAGVGGIECVGLGSDYDGIPTTPVDLPNVSCFPALAAALEERGFREDEIRGIMGENLLRFMEHFE